MVTNDNKQFAGNKEHHLKEYTHIEDWFDEWLTKNDYFKNVYFELLKFESEFYYLKEFIVQTRIAAGDVLQRLQAKTGTQKVIDAIPTLVHNDLSPFEEMLTKWIIAHYLFIHYRHEEKLPNIETFFTTVKTITLRDTQNFPVQVSMNTEGWNMDFNFNGVNGEWKLIDESKALKPRANDEEGKTELPPIKKLRWTKKSVLLAYLLNELQRGGFVEGDIWKVGEQMFVDKDGKSIKHTTFSSMVKNYENNKTPDGTRGKPSNHKELTELIEHLKMLSKGLDQ